MRGYTYKMSILLLILSLLTPARAEMFTWTDKSGITHFSSEAPKSAADKKKAKRFKTRDGSSSRSRKDSAAPAAPVVASKPAASKHKVELYTTSWCGYCAAARAYLAENNIPYQDYDIEADAEAAARYKSYGGRGVPVARIDGQTVSGFAPELYDPLLKP